MYKVINAEKKHAKQILDRITETCYWKEFMEGNKLGKNYDDIMLEWYLNPRIPFIHVIIDDSDDTKIYGCLITMSTDEAGTMPDYTPHMHPKALEIFGPWLAYPVSDSQIVELIYIDKNLRGNSAVYRRLYQIMEETTQANNKTCLSSFVWSFVPDSLVLTTKFGFMVKDVINFEHPLINMPLLYLEKKPEFTAMLNYFESKEYLNAIDLLGITKA